MHMSTRYKEWAWTVFHSGSGFAAGVLVPLAPEPGMPDWLGIVAVLAVMAYSISGILYILWRAGLRA